MNAQYFALIDLNPKHKIWAKASFSLLLILLAWDGDCDVELGLVVVCSIPSQAHAPQLRPGLTRLDHEVARLVFPLLFLLSGSTNCKHKQCLLSISGIILRREKNHFFTRNNSPSSILYQIFVIMSPHHDYDSPFYCTVHSPGRLLLEEIWENSFWLYTRQQPERNRAWWKYLKVLLKL